MAFRSPFPDVAVPDVTLTEFVLSGGAAHPDRPALVDGSCGRAITFAELADGIRRLAAGLWHRGIRPGDVVAVWAPNLPEYAVVFHAVASIGAVLTTALKYKVDMRTAAYIVAINRVATVTKMRGMYA